MKKIIFLDRDGTIVVEPEIDKQLDSFDKLSFIPGVFKYLEKINNELGYDLVLVTNQDGFGNRLISPRYFLASSKLYN